MATKNVVSLKEVQAAQAFLRALGAPWQNSDLIYAVVAWLRVSERDHPGYIGNNPFNLLANSGVPAYLVAGVKRVTTYYLDPDTGRRRVRTDNVILFRNLKDSLVALANVILKRATTSGGYRLILQAARHGTPFDVLNAIALSAWDASHYGYLQADTRTNRLYQYYITFTGMQMMKPAQPKQRHEIIPPQPTVVYPPVLSYPFLDPFQARAFYLARHTEPESIPGL